MYIYTHTLIFSYKHTCIETARQLDRQPDRHTLYIYICVYIWRFPKIGGPQIIHFGLGFSIFSTINFRELSFYGNLHMYTDTLTWWSIPVSKWVITPVISGLTLLSPFITRIITYLLTRMNHQVENIPCNE